MCPLLLRLHPFIHLWIISNLRISVENNSTYKYVVNATADDLQPHIRKHIGLHCATHQAVCDSSFHLTRDKTLTSLLGLFVICLIRLGGTDLQLDILLVHANSVCLRLADALLHLQESSRSVNVNWKPVCQQLVAVSESGGHPPAPAAVSPWPCAPSGGDKVSPPRPWSV